MVVLGPLRAMDVAAFLPRNFHCRALRRLEFPEMFAYTPPPSISTTKVPRRKPAAKGRSHEQKWAVYLDAKAAESPAFVRLLGPGRRSLYGWRRAWRPWLSGCLSPTCRSLFSTFRCE